MAGRLAHMERSHRSYVQTQRYSIFNQFHRKAYATANIKQTRMSIGQRFGQLLNPLKTAMKQQATSK